MAFAVWKAGRMGFILQIQNKPGSMPSSAALQDEAWAANARMCSEICRLQLSNTQTAHASSPAADDGSLLHQCIDSMYAYNTVYTVMRVSQSMSPDVMKQIPADTGPCFPVV